jgi:glycosyltransferase involved in cell wall biosynthesis
MLPILERRYPSVRFVGPKQGEDLARYFSAADVFVFPSRTDTFGLVMLEALASGVPVAAYPVPGPIDVIGDSGTGALDDDLAIAVRKALKIDPARCREYALNHSWQAAAGQFLANVHPCR